jgi:NTP pyrophosphatase (non-canonical NTP hydrolase)
MSQSDDTSTTIADLKTAVQQFVHARNWETYHTSKNLAMSIAIEAAEIMEHFQWLSIEEGQQQMLDPQVHAEVADELADVLIYCLSFANQAQIDITSSIEAKLARNEIRFPIKQVRGKLGNQP